MAFLSLPGELRNAIYDRALFPGHEVIQIVNCSSPEDLVRSVFNSSILRVTPRIRAEALARLCSTKEFEFHDFVSADVFLEYVGKSGKDNITSISISERSPLTERQLATWFKSGLPELSRLQQLNLKIPFSFGSGTIHEDHINGEEQVLITSLKELLGRRGCKVTCERWKKEV